MMIQNLKLMETPVLILVCDIVLVDLLSLAVAHPQHAWSAGAAGSLKF